MPPASEPSCSCAIWVTCLEASAMAPTIRSCKVSMSTGSTTLGSIFTATTSPLPLTIDLDQAAAGLTVDLGVRELLLGLH